MRNASTPGRRGSVCRSQTTPLLRGVPKGRGQRSPRGNSKPEPQNASAPSDGGNSRSSSKTRLCEICSICLEPLAESGCFLFPCGFNHRLHYRCAIVFLLSSLKHVDIGKYVDTVTSPRRRSSITLGDGFRAISAIGESLSRIPLESLHRVCCPLCRGAWPSTELISIETSMDQLRALRVQKLEEAASKMGNALERVQDHFDNGEDAQRARLIKGLLRLDEIYHSATTFFAHCTADDRAATSILSCLNVMGIRNLSRATRKFRDFCTRNYKLRVPHLRVEKLRTAMHYVCANDLVSLEAAPHRMHACMSALEVVTCSKWLSSNEHLRVLVLTGMQWEKVDPECKYLSSSLTNKSLQTLDLSNNDLLDLSVENIGKELANHRDLQVLNLDGNLITAKGFSSILPFANHTFSNKNKGRGIQDWGFRHNQLGDEGCKLLAETISNEWACGSDAEKDAISSWDLRRNRITEFGCKLIATLFGSMAIARLGCNNIGDVGAKHLAERMGNTLLTLDLRQAKIGDEGAIALADKLINCSCLRELLLSGNEIGAPGAQRLADRWAWVSPLELVELSNNPLGREGITSIAEELQYWQQSPFRLSLSSVDCDNHGASELKQALINNCRRDRGWKIELNNNDCCPSHVAGIRALLEPLEFCGCDESEIFENNQIIA